MFETWIWPTERWISENLSIYLILCISKWTPVVWTHVWAHMFIISTSSFVLFNRTNWNGARNASLIQQKELGFMCTFVNSTIISTSATSMDPLRPDSYWRDTRQNPTPKHAASHYTSDFSISGWIGQPDIGVRFRNRVRKRFPIPKLESRSVPIPMIGHDPNFGNTPLPVLNTSYKYRINEKVMSKIHKQHRPRVNIDGMWPGTSQASHN